MKAEALEDKTETNSFFQFLKTFQMITFDQIISK
jgi:hypothetical protein